MFRWIDDDGVENIPVTLEDYHFCDIGTHAGKYHVTITAYVEPKVLYALGGG